jgi:hypothetical protein
MATSARGLPFKIAKAILLCAVAWLLLYGLQLLIDQLYGLLDMKLPWWELHKEWWSKYPIFAIIIYLVYSEAI